MRTVRASVATFPIVSSGISFVRSPKGRSSRVSNAEASRDLADRLGPAEPAQAAVDMDRTALELLATIAEPVADKKSVTASQSSSRPLSWLASRTDRILMVLLALLMVAVIFPDRSPPASVLIALTALVAAGLRSFAATSAKVAPVETSPSRGEASQR